MNRTKEAIETFKKKYETMQNQYFKLRDELQKKDNELQNMLSQKEIEINKLNALLLKKEELLSNTINGNVFCFVFINLRLTSFPFFSFLLFISRLQLEIFQFGKPI